MHLLSRICLQNWYLIDAKDIEIDGATALVGPTGAGKSSIQDAIQTVITGANQNRLNLNPSASGKSARSVLEYCLGLTRDPSEGGKPLRSSCETVLALVFRDEETEEPITIGIAMSAREGDSREEVLSRFIIPGYAYSVENAKRRIGANETLAPWVEISADIRKNHPEMEEYRTSAEKFTNDFLKSMRGSDHTPNVRHFLRSFSNALAFRPIFDPTAFVRDFVLEPDPLDVERVRTSITTWQELEKIIEDVEARLRRVTRLSERFHNWGRTRMRGEAARFTASAAEVRRTAHDVLALKEILKRKSTELSVERSALATRRQWVKELDDELRSKRSLAQSTDSASRIRQIEVEGRLAQRDADDANERFKRLRDALGSIAQLSPVKHLMTPAQGHGLDAAREAHRLMSDGFNPAEAMKAKGLQIQELVDQVLSIEGLEVFLYEKADSMMEELRQLQEKSEHIEQMLSRSGGGNAILSSQATKLLGSLSRKRMNPIPLCDVVEVIDESWQYAIESLLGRGREAIIVEPEHLSEAFNIMWQDRDTYSGCTLVKTSSTSMISLRSAPGSILEAISTDNTHAAAFLNVRIGGFRKAETEEDLNSLDRGVMRNGKTSSGMGLSVQRNLRELVLGRSAREKTSEALRNDLSPVRERLNELRNLTRMLREASRIIPTSIDVIKHGQSPFDLEHALNASQQRLASLHESKSTIGNTDERELLEEIEALEKDRELYQAEVSQEIEPAVERLQGEVASARAKLEHALEQSRSAIKQRKKTWERLKSPEIQRIREFDPEVDEPDAIGTLRRIREDIRRGESDRKDPKAWLASMRNDYKAIADNTDAEVRREQAGAIRELTEYSANWETEVPKIDPDNMTIGYAWVMGEQSRLQNNELRRHKEACTQAAEEMRKMLKEDLLTRLAEKLTKVHHRMETLNGFLSRHRFTGQIYSFEFEVNQRYALMHDLAMKIGGQLNDSPVTLEDEELTNAITELEGMIEGADDATTLADYRQYFVFEIVMTDAGGARTTLSSRAVKGSGGEAQAPFYVAIAASLASAYYPGHSGHGRPSGMGLALFDEAFNKLDVPNTQALLTFFKDMGLQLMIAGPEDKRATFTEVLDTIILVNKSLDGASVYVDAEYPGIKAKEALGEINPDHKGVEHFKQGSAAAE